MSYQELYQVMSALMSSDNALRKEAEAYFLSQQETNADAVVEQLVMILAAQNENLSVRSLSAVLLRRSIDPCTSAGKKVTPGTRAKLRSYLLDLWGHETNPMLLRRMSHVMAQSAADGSWKDLLPHVLERITNNGTSSTAAAVAGLGLIETIADYSPDDISANMSVLGGFLSSFMSAQDTHVQVACARATAACIVSLDDDTARNAFKPAIMPIVSVLGAALSRGDEQDACGVLEHLVDIAAMQPLFYKGALDSLVAAMLTVGNSNELEFSTRSLALELLVTIAEAAPALARRCAALLQGVVPLCMALMLEVEESDEEWAAGPYSAELPDDPCAVGEEALERLAAGIGGRSVLQPALTIVEQYIAQHDTRYRRAAVAALGRLSEGCTKEFATVLPTAMRLLLSSLTADSSMRVQFQAIQTIGRLAVIYPDNLADIVAMYMPPLIAITRSVTCDKVRGHAVSALMNLVNPDTSDVAAVTTHVDSMLSALGECLQYASLQIQPLCISLLGCTAQLLEEKFEPYYSLFMPFLRGVMEAATAPHLVELRGKAMECVGLIGDAVRSEVFAPDALHVMHTLLGAMNSTSGSSDDDITVEYILPACARISNALGEHFAPFLPTIMDPLLRGATQTIHFAMTDITGDDEENEGEVEYDEDTGNESAVISLGGGVKKRVTMNTHAVQQKNQCARMLYEFARGLKGHLGAKYIPLCFEAANMMVTDRHSADIRSSASLAVGKIFEAALDACRYKFITPVEATAMLSGATMKLMEALHGEVQSTSRACAAEALRDVLSACYDSGEEGIDGKRSRFLCAPPLNECKLIATHILQRCQESLERRKERVMMVRGKGECLDAEDENAMLDDLEEEEDYLATLVDALGQLVKLHEEAIMPLFDEIIAPAFAPYFSLPSGDEETLQVVAVCMLDDVIEHGGAAAKKYIPHSLAIFTRNLSSEHNVLRQSSTYGIAQCLRAAPDICVDALDAVVPLLVQLATAEDAREEDNEGITENALFALGMICTDPTLRRPMYAAGTVSLEQLTMLWLRALPLRADEQEAKTASRQLCDALELGSIHASADTLAEILRVIAEVIIASHNTSTSEDYALAHPTTLHRMKEFIRHMQNTMDPNLLSNAFSTLNASNRKAIQGSI